jgi:methanethiol S-methyltransferase
MTTLRAAPFVLQACAWLGGAVFVAALAYYAWFFHTLGTPGPEGAQVGAATAGNIALFTLFAAHHSMMARSGAKAWITRALPPALERSAYVWVASALFIAVCALWQRVPGQVYMLSPPAAWLGWAVQGLGVVFTVAGGRVLDALDLAGIRQTLTPHASSPIRVVWPFTLVRHPIYLGWALIVFGTPVMTRDRLLWAVVSTFYLVIAIPWEERSLSAAAGPAYSAYQKQVRWRLVPGVY